jgi:hypothetical protein
MKLFGRILAILLGTAAAVLTAVLLSIGWSRWLYFNPVFPREWTWIIGAAFAIAVFACGLRALKSVTLASAAAVFAALVSLLLCTVFTGIDQANGWPASFWAVAKLGMQTDVIEDELLSATAVTAGLLYPVFYMIAYAFGAGLIRRRLLSR